MARQLQSVTASVLAAVVSGHAAQDAPRFRGGVDLITVDVAAVDSKGKPVDDLGPRDFTVKVDGKPRAVVSADFMKVDRAKGSAPQRTGAAQQQHSQCSRLNHDDGSSERYRRV